MAGLSPRRLSGRQGGKSKSSSQSSSANRSDETSTRTALMEQAKHGTSKGFRGVDKRAGGMGGAAVRRVGSAAGATKSRVGSAAANNLPFGKTGIETGKKLGHAGKKGGKRVAKDTQAGMDYTTRNLHQSPVDWAEAGLERYRENPVVDTPSEDEAKQQKLSNWSEKTSNKGHSE